MATRKNRKLAKFGLVVAVVVAANTLGANGYTPMAGLRWAWAQSVTRLDRTVSHALAVYP